MNADNKTPCPICREVHEPRGLSFDGQGINSCGMYRARVATVLPYYRELGEKMATAFNSHDAMREALAELLADLDTMREPYRNEAICERARAALELAEGKP